jgi:hypothetical protein
MKQPFFRQNLVLVVDRVCASSSAVLIRASPSLVLSICKSDVDISFKLMMVCPSCLQLVEKFQLDEMRLVQFLHRVEEGYPSNPYHNRMHAADVLQSLHVLLCQGGLMQSNVCDDLSLLSCYLAAVSKCSFLQIRLLIINDYQHNGVNNTLLCRSYMTINTRDWTIICCADHTWLSTQGIEQWSAVQIIHDYQHKGVNNDFLVRTGDNLAVSMTYIRH